MRLFRSIILILSSAVGGLWNQLPVSNTIAAQLIGHSFPGLAAINAQYFLKNRLAVAPSRFA